LINFPLENKRVKMEKIIISNINRFLGQQDEDIRRQATDIFKNNVYDDLDGWDFQLAVIARQIICRVEEFMNE